MSRALLAQLRGAAVAAVYVFALSGCVADDPPVLGPKHLQPLSPQMLTLIEQKGMRRDSPILLRIFKEESEIEVWKQTNAGRYELLKTYPICRWSGELGPKIAEGDRQAPEGFYSITPELMNPRSNYYLAFNLGYPNEFDRANDRTGSYLMVHGACSSAGCYSMTDEQIGEIFALARESFDGGQLAFQVQAYPFRMTAKNLARHRRNPHSEFWQMLKEGSDHFELTKLPPKIDVCEKRYIFDAHLTDPSTLSSPKGACPAFSVPQEIATAVAAKREADQRTFNALVQLGLPAAPIGTGRDGSTNPVFAEAHVSQGEVGPQAQKESAASPRAIVTAGPTAASAAALPAASAPWRHVAHVPASPRQSGQSAQSAPTPADRERKSEQKESSSPPAMSGASPIRSSGSFSYD